MGEFVLVLVFLFGNAKNDVDTYSRGVRSSSALEVYFYDKDLCNHEAELWRATPGVFVARCMQVSK